VSYSRKYPHIRVEVVMATRELVRAKLWRSTMDEQGRAIEKWIATVSAAYGMPEPLVRFAPLSVLGAFVPAQGPGGMIVMDHFSVVTLLHEYRHAMHLAGVAGAIGGEEDARAWSLSLFRLAAPRRFRRMRAEGRLAFLRPEPEPVNLTDAESQAFAEIVGEWPDTQERLAAEATDALPPVPEDGADA
jgi:hypothetical protein